MKTSRIEDLKTQRANLQNFIGNAPALEQSLTAELSDLERQLEAADRAFLRTGNRGALDELESRTRTLRDSLETHRRRAKIARFEAGEVDQEIAHEERRVQERFRKSAYDLADEINDRLRKDSKLRKDLADLFALYAACGAVVWEAVLIDVFPIPTDAELAKVTPAARAKIEKALQ